MRTSNGRALAWVGAGALLAGCIDLQVPNADDGDIPPPDQSGDYDPGADDGGGGGGAGVTSAPFADPEARPPTEGGGAGGAGEGGSPGTGAGKPVPDPGACSQPIALADPGEASGDTMGHANHADPTTECAGAGAPDLVYRFTAGQTGILTARLTAALDLRLYVETECGEAASQLACAKAAATSGVFDSKVEMQVDVGQELYFVVDGATPSTMGLFDLDVATRPIACGDGLVDPGEACDPPDGTFCNALCNTMGEICDDGVDNDQNGLLDCAEPACAADTFVCPGICTAPGALGDFTSGDTTGGSTEYSSTCTRESEGHQAVFVYEAPASGVLKVGLAAATDMGLFARESCVDPGTSAACAERGDAVAGEELCVPVLAGRWLWVFADAKSPADDGPFTLTRELKSVSEVEPNDDHPHATYVDLSALEQTGAIYPLGDQDWYTVDVPDGASRLVATTSELCSRECQDGTLDSEVQILDDDAKEVAFDDDASGSCSRAVADPIPPGTYHVRIGSSGHASPRTFGYRVTFTIE